MRISANQNHTTTIFTGFYLLRDDLAMVGLLQLKKKDHHKGGSQIRSMEESYQGN